MAHIRQSNKLKAGSATMSGGNSGDGIGMVYWNGVYTPLYNIPATIYVATTGSDSNAGTSGSPYATINKALSVATAGSVIQVAAGTYSESSAYAWFTTTACLSFVSNGTSGQPIILRAASGASVKVDGSTTKAGIYLRSHDYIYIAGLEVQNCYLCGIGAMGEYNDAYGRYIAADCSNYVVIENCYIHDVLGETGSNTAAIHGWGTSDWVVRNNRIDNMTGAGASGHGWESYATRNAKIYNNTITVPGRAIYFKDHFVADIDGTPVDESEVWNNWLKSTAQSAISSNIRGTGERKSGNHYWHNNICIGAANNAAVEANNTSTLNNEVAQNVRVENNIVDGGANSGTKGVFICGFNNATIRGNIIVRCNIQLETQLIANDLTGSANTRIMDEDYNIHVPNSSFQVFADRYAPTAQTFTSLSSWMAANASTGPISVASAIGDNSATSTTGTLFNNISTADYTHKTGSPALSFMPDSSNAGAYRLGTETIGVIA